MDTSKTQASSRGQDVVERGTVDSISGSKTVRVVLENLVKHAFYGKYLRRRTRLLAHDASGQVRVGDMVDITPCRPLSRRKSWRVLRVVKSAQTA